jgi:hypothetical protein
MSSVEAELFSIGPKIFFNGIFAKKPPSRRVLNVRADMFFAKDFFQFSISNDKLGMFEISDRKK